LPSPPHRNLSFSGREGFAPLLSFFPTPSFLRSRTRFLCCLNDVPFSVICTQNAFFLCFVRFSSPRMVMLYLPPVSFFIFISDPTSFEGCSGFGRFSDCFVFITAPATDFTPDDDQFLFFRISPALSHTSLLTAFLFGTPSFSPRRSPTPFQPPPLLALFHLPYL